MNEVILTLILYFAGGMTTTTMTYDEAYMTCEEAGEQYVGEWLNTPTHRYLVRGYICNHSEGVDSVIYPFQYDEQE